MSRTEQAARRRLNASCMAYTPTFAHRSSRQAAVPTALPAHCGPRQGAWSPTAASPWRRPLSLPGTPAGSRCGRTRRRACLASRARMRACPRRGGCMGQRWRARQVTCDGGRVKVTLTLSWRARQVTYDPREVGYERLLSEFFRRVDPTTRNRQVRRPRPPLAPVRQSPPAAPARACAAHGLARAGRRAGRRTGVGGGASEPGGTPHASACMPCGRHHRASPMLPYFVIKFAISYRCSEQACV